MPRRQPYNAPSDDLAQKKQGFVKFLQKHSSPTHQRVTTGGRIVPMEQPHRPPIFSLPPGDTSPISFTECKTNDGRRGLEEQGPTESQANPTTQSHVPPTHVESLDKIGLGLGAGLDLRFLPPPESLSTTTVSSQPESYTLLPHHSIYPLPSFDPYGLPSPPLYPASAVSFTPAIGGFGGPFNLPGYSGPPVPYGEMYSLTGSQQMADNQLYCQNILMNVMTRFDDLDKQLKSLDRHRAMSGPDPAITEQRMMVAQQRAEAKLAVSYWQQTVAKTLVVSSGSSAIPQTRGLNVQAPTYVPLASPATSVMPLSASTSNGSKSESLQSAVTVHKAALKRIPIVPPPDSSRSHEKVNQGIQVNIQNEEDQQPQVDEWGARIGRPPPHIEREQSKMLEAMIREAKKSPEEQYQPQGSIVSQNHSTTSSFGRKSIEDFPPLISEDDTDRAESLPSNPGRAPATVEAYYETQLDAMRLPQGIIADVKLPDGTLTEVPGRGLQRPPSFEMDEFEHRYWTSRPVLTPEMMGKFVNIRRTTDTQVSDLTSSAVALNDLSFDRQVLY